MYRLSTRAQGRRYDGAGVPGSRQGQGLAISTGSFEIAGSEPGRASGWSLDSIQGDWLFASFDGALPDGSATRLGFEGFEEDLDGYLFSFSEAAQDSAFMPADDFEAGWQNVPYFLGFPEFSVLAVFDTTPEPFEDFEEEWDSNESYWFDWSEVPSTDAADFDTAPEPFEDFEEEWRSNESYWFDWSEVPSTDAADFDTAPEPFEDFEEEWPTEIASTV